MPQLAPVVDDIAAVPEPARQFYAKKDDGKYHVDLTGAPAGFVPAADLATANGKIIEFRDTNIGLKKQVDADAALREQFKDLDPAAARLAIERVKELEKAGVKKPDDVTAAVNLALDTFKSTVLKPVQDQLTQITTQAADERKRNEALITRSTISDRFIKAGGVPEALDFIVSRAAGVFTVKDGNLVAVETQFSTDKPGEKLTVDEWLTRQTKEASFAFKPSGGGGADPKPGAGKVKAGQTVLKDPTAQQLGEHAKDIAAGKIRLEYSS